MRCYLSFLLVVLIDAFRLSEVINLGLASEIIDINPLKTDIRPNYMYGFSSYLTENTPHVQC